MTPERVREFDDVVSLVRLWAERQPDVQALGLAGSWARGAQHLDSDVDLVVLTTVPEHYEGTREWIGEALGRDAALVRTQRWGVLIERRVVLPSGFQVEFGFVATDWASIDPLDGGTARVVGDGFVVLHDPEGILDALVRRVRGT